MSVLDFGTVQIVGAVIMCVAVAARNVGAGKVSGWEVFAFGAVLAVIVFCSGLAAFAAPWINGAAILCVVGGLPAVFALCKFGDVLPEFDANLRAEHMKGFCEE